MARSGTSEAGDARLPAGAAGAAPRSASKGELTRRAILEAAIARFGRDGYRATSVAEIARDVSIGGTVAYAYFPNKEALFLAAVDHDAAGVIVEGVSHILEDLDNDDWRATLVFTFIGALDHHPLARRLLAGLEPEFTARAMDVPALHELRKACAERLRTEQATGHARPDIDAEAVANGIVTICLSLLRAVVQIGSDVTASYAEDVAAVFAAALDPIPQPPA